MTGKIHEVRCTSCARIVGYGTGKVTCVWCAPLETSAHYEARAEAFDAAMDNEEVDVARDIRQAYATEV